MKNHLLIDPRNNKLISEQEVGFDDLFPDPSPEKQTKPKGKQRRDPEEESEEGDYALRRPIDEPSDEELAVLYPRPETVEAGKTWKGAKYTIEVQSDDRKRLEQNYNLFEASESELINHMEKINGWLRTNKDALEKAKDMLREGGDTELTSRQKRLLAEEAVKYTDLIYIARVANQKYGYEDLERTLRGVPVIGANAGVWIDAAEKHGAIMTVASVLAQQLGGISEPVVADTLMNVGLWSHGRPLLTTTDADGNTIQGIPWLGGDDWTEEERQKFNEGGTGKYLTEGLNLLRAYIFINTAHNVRKEMFAKDVRKFGLLDDRDIVNAWNNLPSGNWTGRWAWLEAIPLLGSGIKGVEILGGGGGARAARVDPKFGQSLAGRVTKSILTGGGDLLSHVLLKVFWSLPFANKVIGRPPVHVIELATVQALSNYNDREQFLRDLVENKGGKEKIIAQVKKKVRDLETDIREVKREKDAIKPENKNAKKLKDNIDKKIEQLNVRKDNILKAINNLSSGTAEIHKSAKEILRAIDSAVVDAKKPDVVEKVLKPIAKEMALPDIPEKNIMNMLSPAEKKAMKPDEVKLFKKLIKNQALTLGSAGMDAIKYYKTPAGKISSKNAAQELKKLRLEAEAALEALKKAGKKAGVGRLKKGDSQPLDFGAIDEGKQNIIEQAENSDSMTQAEIFLKKLIDDSKNLEAELNNDSSKMDLDQAAAVEKTEEKLIDYAKKRLDAIGAESKQSIVADAEDMEVFYNDLQQIAALLKSPYDASQQLTSMDPVEPPAPATAEPQTQTPVNENKIRITKSKLIDLISEQVKEHTQTIDISKDQLVALVAQETFKQINRKK
jgi:hypothetical protein